jgi:hypothetical protein
MSQDYLNIPCYAIISFQAKSHSCFPGNTFATHNPGDHNAPVIGENSQAFLQHAEDF